MSPMLMSLSEPRFRFTTVQKKSKSHLLSFSSREAALCTQKLFRKCQDFMRVTIVSRKINILELFKYQTHSFEEYYKIVFFVLICPRGGRGNVWELISAEQKIVQTCHTPGSKFVNCEQ